MKRLLCAFFLALIIGSGAFAQCSNGSCGSSATGISRFRSYYSQPMFQSSGSCANGSCGASASTMTYPLASLDPAYETRTVDGYTYTKWTDGKFYWDNQPATVATAKSDCGCANCPLKTVAAVADPVAVGTLYQVTTGPDAGKLFAKDDKGNLRRLIYAD